jgi:alanine racemase
MLSEFSTLLGLDEVSSPGHAALRGSWYEIDIEAIRHNYQQLRLHLPRPVQIYACLKRNAYGCGAAVVAASLESEGADGFAVASMLDAIAIRRAGVLQPILLYPGPGLAAAPIIDALDLTVTISSKDELKKWRSVLRQVRAFVKVDLGFLRAGAPPSQICEILAEASADPAVDVAGIYAHMIEAPRSNSQQAQAQLARMQELLLQIEGLGLRPPITMMSSTEGALSHPELDFDAVDPGALFIGAALTDAPVRPVDLRPALRTIATRLVSVKQLDGSLGPVPPATGLKAGMRIGVIAMGWGDGLPRMIPEDAVVLVRGRRARLLPPAHLEHVRVDLSNVPEAGFGDEVVLLGRQGNDEITHFQLTAQWGIDLVGLHAGLRDHIPRLYVQPFKPIRGIL